MVADDLTYYRPLQTEGQSLIERYLRRRVTNSVLCRGVIAVCDYTRGRAAICLHLQAMQSQKDQTSVPGRPIIQTAGGQFRENIIAIADEIHITELRLFRDLAR